VEIEAKQPVAESILERRLISWVMKRAGNPRISIRLWNGDEFYVSDGTPVACMEFRDRRVVLELLLSTNMGFGECYSRGLIEVHGNFLAFANEFTRAIHNGSAQNYFWQKFQSLITAVRSNTLSRSQLNVHHHYDLGNDFYKLWLDERMVYTCGYYDHPAATLDEAQVAKLDHVSRKLQLQPGQDVIEAGCGWGALAMHMAEHYGVNVKAYNNSHEQVAYARLEAQRRGLGKQVEFIEDDYRSVHERCDVFVSIGMLEHVGRRNYRTLGELIARSLKPGGIGLIHTIGRSHPRRTDPWIRKHIFPGGHVPSLGEMAALFEPFRFSILDIENLRMHYARTCRAWLDNFENVSDQVRDMYDDEFVRAWRLYLAGSSAGFESGTLQLYQVLFAPGRNNDVPWTRQYQYRSLTRQE